MMNCEYSSKLTFDDLRKYLANCFFGDCNLEERFFMVTQNGKERWKKKVHFSHDGKKYILFFDDTDAEIYEIRERNWRLPKEHSRLVSDNWHCFMYSKFGVVYLDKYKKHFESHEHVFGSSMFASKLSLEEIWEYVTKICNYEEHRIKVIEIDSISKAERRVLVKVVGTCCFRYFRISDFDAISLYGCTSQYFIKFMTHKFGETYINAYEKYLMDRIELVELAVERSRKYQRLDKKIIGLEEVLKEPSWYSKIS